MSPQSAIALCSALLGLGGCSNEGLATLNRTIDALTGTVNDQGIQIGSLVQDNETYRAELARLALVSSPTVPAPPDASVAEVEPFECVSIFKIQTCEGGVLYQLDESFNWILPGRTE